MRTKLTLALLVLAAVVAAAAAAIPASGATRGVRLVDNAFRPGTLTVRQGDSVRFRWAGRLAHNVVVQEGPAEFRSKVQRTGTYRKRLTRRGTYTIVCELHPGMNLTLRVRAR